MGAKIDAYIDVVSLYSYLAFVELMRNKEILQEHGVEIELHPVLLAGINAGSGNKPPWTLPAKAKYLTLDSLRSKNRAGRPELSTPKDLMAMSMTVAPLRALWYIKQNYPSHVYYTAFHYLFHCFWTAPNRNVSDKKVLREVLTEAPARGPLELDTPEEKLFGLDEVGKILEGAESSEAKEAVKKSTQEALDKGAFGAPWWWVTNAEGKAEPFFGSDRWHFIYKHLGVPFQDVKLLPPQAGNAVGKDSKL